VKRVIPVLGAATLVALVLLAGCAREDEDVASAEEIVWVWYPNESTPEFADARTAIIAAAQEAVGRPITEQLTTDYAIAIEALVNDNAAFSWFGGEGYIQAHARNESVLPLVTASTTDSLDDAKYYSMLGTLVENEDQYKVSGQFDLSTLRQKSFSFVSNSSTSGFRVPSSVISTEFNVDSQELLEGGDDMVFSEVMFGGSHQGSFFNVLNGQADLGAFCNVCIDSYIEWVSGELNDPLPGDIIRVKEGADAPFDQVVGTEVVLIETVPVLNAPIVMNTNLLSDDEVKTLRDAFTSQAMMQNKDIFGPEGSSAFFEEGERFLLVEDGWYDPIRRLAGMIN
jgi:phosphonate transport system substrate-binding protein